MDTSIEILSGRDAVNESTDTGAAGFTRLPRGSKDPRVIAKLDESLRIFERGLSGSLRGRADLAEALTTSDFPILLGGVFDRELLAQYEDITPVWQSFARRSIVKDFRAKKLVDLLGGRAILDPVAEGAPYPGRKVTESDYELKVGKRGARIPLTWEMLINDDLDAFRDLPSRLATGARDTEDYLATSLLVKASGVNTDFFKSANKNAPTALPLTHENLGVALTAVSTRKDSENRPIINRGTVLMVPPALELQALAILNATEIRNTEGNKVLVGGNELRSKVTLVVNPWLPVIATDGKTDGRWFILPAPTAARPALAVGFLRGHEVPDLRVKNSAGVRVGGGTIAPEEGSFEFDDIQYRVRHVLGGTPLDPIGTYVSNGS
jgi:hypothetical protein